ncbi:MAG: prepilin peptidase [Bdellovibrionales bacterium]
MFSLIVFLSFLFFVIAYGVMSAISDFKGLRIPNINSVVIFVLFCVCYGLLWILGGVGPFASIGSHLIGFVIVFLGSFALYAMKVWGAGDQKLISALSIWMGFSAVPAFLVYTSLFGGVLGLTALVLKKFKPVQSPLEGSWIAQVQDGVGKVPYGIAIVLGALACFLKIGYFSVDTFRIFL